MNGSLICIGKISVRGLAAGVCALADPAQPTARVARLAHDNILQASDPLAEGQG
jgi:hypothetical protein